MHLTRLPFAAAALLLLALAAAPWGADAQGKASFNVTAVNAYPLPGPPGQINMSPYTMPADCDVKGVCVPFTFTLPPRTLWTWCGWYSDQRTDYLLSANGTIGGAQLMRVGTLNTCAIPSLSTMSTCEAIYNSACGGGKSCTMRVLALMYRDEVCLVVANNNNTYPLKLDVQVFQYYDSPRYYGTIFTIIMTIIMLGGVATWIVWTCYTEITTPPDRLHELRTFEASLIRSQTILGGDEQSPAHTDDGKAEPDRDASDPGSFQGRVKTALNRAKNLVLRRGAGSQV